MSRCQPEQPPRTHHVCQLHTAHFVRARTDIKVGEGWRAGVVGPPICGGRRPAGRIGRYRAIGRHLRADRRSRATRRRAASPSGAGGVCRAAAFEGLSCVRLRLPRRGARGGVPATAYAALKPSRTAASTCMHANTNMVEFRQPKTTEEALGLRTPPCNPMRSGGAQPAAYPPAACCCCCCPPPDRPLP
jgi:hypothetical protein